MIPEFLAGFLSQNVQRALHYAYLQERKELFLIKIANSLVLSWGCR